MNQYRIWVKDWLCCVLLLTILLAGIPTYGVATKKPNQPGSRTRTEFHQSTEWQVTASFKFDTLCFLNLLTGDPFYLRHYQKVFDEFAPRLTPAARTALANLKRKIKDENKNIISSFLCLNFSTTDDQTLDDMLRSLNETDRLKRALQQTAYFSEGGWQLFKSVKGELNTLFQFLKESNFTDYWKQKILPRVNDRVATLGKDVATYNVVTEIEKCLGFALASNRITIYLLAFAWPHGMKITGTRFIADVSYPLPVILQNAVHEMMHPPYRLNTDRELRTALSQLKADAFLMDKVLNHNPSFGYNSLESFIEEDCVRALEQIITEKLNFGREAHQRWKDEDDGMHVFAVVLYNEMKQQSFNQGNETFRESLLRALISGKLKAGRLKVLYESFYSGFDSGVISGPKGSAVHEFAARPQDSREVFKGMPVDVDTL